MIFKLIARERLIALFLILLIFSNYNDSTTQHLYISSANSSNPSVVTPPFIDNIYFSWADSVMKKMSLNEKIGQLFMVAAYSNRDEQHVKDIAHLIKKYKIGGLIFMQGGPYRQAKLNNYYQKISKLPLLIAMDAEYGLGMRLDSTISYPDQMTLGAIQDNHLIYEMGRDIALQLKRLGVHVNFAPVVDINNNPNNPVINTRSFGENKYNVTSKSLAYMLGMQDNNILATGKHFPGHGDTDKDSHYSLPVIKHSYERIDSIELYPFKELINFGLGSVMTAHLHVPSIDSTKDIPTSLSSIAIDSILKDKLGFLGLVVSDALNMQGVAHFGNGGKVETEAFKAGNDVILFPSDVPKALERIKKEIKKGKISIDEINDGCRKILAVKKWVGLDNYKPVELSNLHADLHKTEFQLTRKRLIEASVTLLNNTNNIIPVKQLDKKKIAYISVGDTINNEFHNYLSLYSEITPFSLAKDALVSEFDSLQKEMEAYNLIIIGIHKPIRSISKNYGIHDTLIQFIEELSKSNHVISCFFNNPYAIKKFQLIRHSKGIIAAYEDNDDSRRYVAQAIFGGIYINGKLPVSINHFKEGDGLSIDTTIRFKYTIPEDIGINSSRFYKIDSIIKDAIENRAIPGCQVLCAKGGVVFYNRSFGHHTYLEKKKVSNDDLYDLASITKISATVPSLMRLVDEEKFHLGEKLSTYLPELQSTNKKDIISTDILTHQARLKSWIPFYLSVFEPIFKDDELFSNEFSKDYPYKISHKLYINKYYRIKDSVLAHKKDAVYSIPISDNLYMHKRFIDSVYHNIDISELREKNGYRYSDLGYYYFYKLVENISGERFEEYLDSVLYKPLGAKSLTYLPLNKFDKDDIVPTENDRLFRQGTIRGYVHDPGAAMLGGVCGHAGLFGNANDLAKLMQLYLNEGSYGGKKYFDSETIDMFTTKPYSNYGNRRGIGFDKPEPNENKANPVSDLASLASYGHTGFTGTIAWVDPEHDLVFVFLSNRIYPDQTNTKLIKLNVRTKIQEEFYKAITD